MPKRDICLEAFYSSELLQKDKNFIYLYFLIVKQKKVLKVFFSQNKMKAASDNHQIYYFLKSILNENQYLAVLNSECNHV